MAQKNRGRIYWPNCNVCQYIKRNPELRKQIYESSYYDPQGSESLMQVFRRWGEPFKEPTIYSHMRRHQSKPTQAMELTAPPEAVPIQDLEPEVMSSTAYERGLDEVIAKGRNMLRNGELKITTQSFLTAIRNKHEVVKTKNDQGIEAMKLMAGAFAGTSATGGTSVTIDPGPTQISDS